MTPEQKRIKLAEFYGWTNMRKNTGTGYLLGVKATGGLASVPNYFNDLNAIHELRSKLTDRQKEVLAHYLAFSKLPDDGYIGYIELPPIDVFDVINSPADVQAEALGKTLNLW